MSPRPTGVETLAGPVLPGLVDAHSHAFQRAFAGLAERRDAAHDDFWSWRDRMYGVALRITPEQLRAIAAHLYVELLRGGYTQVCEFHYLQHDHDGSRYADPAAMSRALADAAAEAGIGLTLLPVLYERAGFAAPALRADQRRFATSVADVLALQRAVARAAARQRRRRDPFAARGAARVDRSRWREGSAGPMHIHVAEQTAEVDDCLAATGCRPIEWLARHAPLDARWQLVHATHSVPAEIDAVAARGAGVVLCPSTEANLGDGLSDLPGWLAAGVPLAIGSDSQVTRAWPEELRWLEYGQRLGLRRRNVSAAPGRRAVDRGAAVRARERRRRRGGRLCALGPAAPVRAPTCSCSIRATRRCAACRPITCSTALVFAAPARPFARVMVAGRWRALHDEGIASRFDAAMQALWAPGGRQTPLG